MENLITFAKQNKNIKLMEEIGIGSAGINTRLKSLDDQVISSSKQIFEGLEEIPSITTLIKEKISKSLKK